LAACKFAVALPSVGWTPIKNALSQIAGGFGASFMNLR